MITVQLLRYAARGDGVFGQLIGPKFRCFTVERPWLDNQNDLSCVPAGSYPMRFEHSPKFNRMLWELKDVPNRSETKLHPANRATELQGCIGLGEAIGQDANGWLVTNSRATIEAFHKAMGIETEAQIVILDVPGPETALARTIGGPE